MRAAAALVVTALVTCGAAGCGNDWGAPAQDESDPSRTTVDTLPAADTEVVPVDAPGITPTEIRVGGVASVTNPLGGHYDGSFDGVQAYFDLVNEQGGVWGRKLVLAAQRDDKLANNKTEVDALLSVDEVFAVLPVATLLFTGADRLVRDQVPTFGWTINPEWEARDGYPAYNLFGQSGSFLCFTCASPTLPWLVREAGAARVGVLAYAVPQSADCADGVRKSFEEYGEATGTEVAFLDKSLSYGPSDLSVQVSKMKDAEVDFVTTCMDTNGVVTLAKEMKKQGLDAVQSLPNAYDHAFIEEFGDLFEGSYVRTDFTQFELEDKPEGLQLYLDRIQAAGQQPSENSIAGWLNAQLFVEGLKAAGPDFSRQKLIDAINEMTQFDAGGIIDGVDWTKGHDQRKSDTRFCQFLSRIEDSEFVTTFSEPGKPFVCAVVTPDGVETEHSS